MLYQINGKQIDIGEALQTHAKSVVDAIAAKYAERPTDATIIFSRSANEFVCEVSVHLSTGITAQANAHDHEIYASFDAASEKVEKQLRRYKRRLKDHHRDRTHPVELSGASSYVNGPPEVMHLSIYLYENLVQVPLPVRIRSHPTDPVSSYLSSKHRTKSIPPKPNCFVADLNASLVQKIFQVTE
jgi:ribosomal subunit interface protein